MNHRSSHILWPLLLVIGTSIAGFFLYSLFFQGESFISSPRGPWIDSGPPIWINWSTAEIMNRAFAAGQFPIWSNSIGIGVPLLADPHLSYFSPFSWILYLMPNSYGWDVMVLSKAILILVFAYALALRLGMNAWMSAWVAVVYGYSGHVFQYLHHFHTNSLAFAPLVLIAALDIFERRYRRGILLAMFSLPLMIFGGGLLDTIELSILLVFISIGYFLLAGAPDKPACSVRIGRMIAAGIIFLLAILVAAIWIVPYIELRDIAVPPRPNRSTAYYNNLWYLFGLFMKNSMAPNVEISHWFMRSIQYMSIIALPGFLAGSFTALTTRSRYQYVYLGFLLLIVLQILKLYGFPPIQVINQIPILQDIRFEKYIGLYTLGFSLISGYGYQTAAMNTHRGAVKVLGVATVVVLGLIAGYVLANNLSWNSGLTTYLLFALYPMLALVIWRWRRAENPVVHAALVMATSVLVLYQLSIDTSTRFDKRLDLFQNDTLVDAALKVSSTKRFFPISASGPRTWSAEGLNDVRDISVVHTRRYHRYFKKIVEKDKPCWHRFVLCSSRASLVYLQGLRWLGVDTLILSDDQLSLLNDNPDKEWSLAGRFEKTNFVTLKNVEPLISVVTPDMIRYREPGIKEIRKGLASGNMPVYLEAPAQKASVPSGSNVWNIESVVKSGVDTTIVVQSTQPGYLLVKQQYYPGWVATVAGEDQPIYQANYVFQAVPIPSGRSIVELSYRPRSLWIGMALSIIAILILMLIYRFVRPSNLFSKSENMFFYRGC